MENQESRLVILESRFDLIQRAADNAWDDATSTQSRSIIATRIEQLDRDWSKFEAEHENLSRSDCASLREQPYIKNRLFERCREFYIQARGTLQSYLTESDSVRPSTSASFSNPPVISNSGHRAMLPRISLPHFAGDYQSWTSFRDLFSSIIANNPEVNEVEKMHYLKTCLSGEAARLISNLSVSGQNFRLAWNALTSRYENKRFLVAAQIDRLFDLKPLKPRSSRELSSLLSTISESLGALRALDCPVQYWDALLVHLLVRLLDKDTREAWEVKLGSTTVIPNLSQLEDFLLGRIRVMENLESHVSSSTQLKDQVNPVTT